MHKIFWLGFIFLWGMLPIAEAQSPPSAFGPWSLQQLKIDKQVAAGPAISLKQQTWVLVGSAATRRVAVMQFARQTKRPVYQVSLRDRYIGETEKNLIQLLKWAKKEQAILFFDEADSLFGKRTAVKDHHNRYANQEVSYVRKTAQKCKFCVILGMQTVPPTAWDIDAADIRRLPD